MINLIPKAYAIDIGQQFTLGNGLNPIANKIQSLSVLIVPLSQNLVILASIILFIISVVGGLKFIVGTGNGDKESMEKGKSALTAAIFGFIIIFAAYWIVKIIEFITGTNIFNTRL